MATPEELNALLIQLATQAGGAERPQQANQGLLAPAPGGGISQPLVSGLLSGVAASLDPRTVSPLASGIVGGLQGFGQRQATDLANRRAEAEFRQKQLQSQIGNILDIGQFGISQQAEARLQRGQEFTQAGQERVDIIFPDGGIQSGVVGSGGRVSIFTPQGELQDVSGQLPPGTRVAPSGRQQQIINVDARARAAEKATNVLNKAFLERLASPENVNAVKANQQAIVTAKRAEALSGDALTGAGAETLINIGSGISTLLRASGMDLAADRINVSTEQQLRATSVDALKPYIEAQGRGFTDADRENALKGIAGLANSRETNRMLARIAQVTALGEQDKFFFDDAIGGQLTEAGGTRTTPSGSEAAFNQYSRDLSHSKIVNGDFRVIDRGAQLWKYYLDGRPKTWITSQGEFTTSQLKEFAKNKGLTFREFLENRELKGEIQGVR